MSINSLFEISQRSFRALNSKMNATGQNIANSDSEGYSRRRATLEANNTVSPGLYTSPAQNNSPGDGASVASFERVRDRMLDQAAAEAQTGQSGAREEARILSVLEGSLATDTEGSLTSSLESFFGGLNDLANNPDDQGVRQTVLAKADALTGEFNRLDQQIGKLASDTQSALSDSVDEANSLIKEVATLNEKISEARASGTPDLAAKDRRDTAVKELSKLIPVETQENTQNGYTLSVDGMNVVQGKETTLLQAQTSQRQASKEFSVTATDDPDLTTSGGKEDAVSIDQGDFGNDEGPGNLDSRLVEGDPSPHVGVEAPISSGGDFEGSLEGGTFDITVEDGEGSQELNFIVENDDGDIVTGGAQTVDLSSGDNDIILEEGSGGTDDIELDLLDGSKGFSPDDVTSGKIEKSTVEFGNTGVAFEPGDEDAGELGAQLRALNQTLPEVQGQLDSLAKDVVTEVNAVHDGGFDQNGNTGNAFFDPAGTTASTIQRAVNGPEEIAAYGAADEPGDTTPAQNMADLSDTLTPKSIDLAANVGSKVQQAAAREEAKAATADHLESMAEGVSGVSVDEEMSNLIEQQQQFAASARVLRTAQEMTSTLLSM